MPQNNSSSIYLCYFISTFLTSFSLSFLWAEFKYEFDDSKVCRKQLRTKATLKTHLILLISFASVYHCCAFFALPFLFSMDSASTFDCIFYHEAWQKGTYICDILVIKHQKKDSTIFKWGKGLTQKFGTSNQNTGKDFLQKWNMTPYGGQKKT